MKTRYLITVAAAALISIQITAQNPDDALRYSQKFYAGTARFSAMGGAFTALGGDLSSLVLNPAGTAFFRSSEFSVTPVMGYTSSTTYFTSRGEDLLYNYNIGQAGVVTPIVLNNTESGLVSVNVGYSYNMTGNFSSNILITGISSTSSMADYWASISNGIFFPDLDGVAGMAYDAWLMDTITSTEGMQYATVFSRYGESIVSTYGQTIRRVINNDGFGGEHSFAVGANFGNNLYIGALLGYSKFNYTGHYEHLETDPGNNIYDFSSFSYVDHYEADGMGFSLKAGLIYAPFDFLRVGMAVHSPVIYNVSEYYYEDLSSVFDDGDRYEFKSDAFRFDYRLTTPYRVLGGVALQIRRSALISLDYEFVDYSISRLSMASDGYDYYDENQSIKEIFTTAHNIRAGAEYRLGSIYFRGGYGYYGRVFNENEANRDNFHTSLSGGIGFRQSNFFIDLAYTRFSNSMIYYMYNYQNVDPVTIETTRSNFSATLGLKF